MSNVELYKNSLDYFKSRIKKNYDDKSRNNYSTNIKRIVKVLDSYNGYLLLSDGYAERIWTDMCNKIEDMGNFLIEETGLYIRNCFNDNDEIDIFINLIATSFSKLNCKNNVLEEVLLNPMPTEEEALNSIYENIWLLTIIMIKDAVDEKL